MDWLNSSTLDMEEVNHVRLSKPDRGSITSFCKHPVCAAHAARPQRRSSCFVKEVKSRLADAVLIRTERERERGGTGTLDSRDTRATRRGKNN